MKKFLYLIPLLLIAGGCVQKTADLTQPLQQLSTSVEQVNQKVDALDAKVTALEETQNSVIPSTVPTDWKTYEDTSLGVTVRYPTTWTVTEKKGMNAANVAYSNVSIDAEKITPSLPSANSYVPFSVTINKEDNPDNLSLNQIYQKGYATYQACQNRPAEGLGCLAPENPSAWQPVTIGAASAFRTGKRSNPEGYPSDQIYIQKTGYFIIVSGIYKIADDDSRIANYANQFNTIVSSIILTL